MNKRIGYIGWFLTLITCVILVVGAPASSIGQNAKPAPGGKGGGGGGKGGGSGGSSTPYYYAPGNWGGYLVPTTSSTPVTAVSASWTVPSLDCSALPLIDSSVLIWVGIGVNVGTIEQAGIQASCDTQGQFSARPFYEFFPLAAQFPFPGQPDPYTIDPGDQITTQVRQSGTSGNVLLFDFSVKNNTKGWTYPPPAQNPIAPPCQQGSSCYITSANLNSAEWEVEICCSNVDVPQLTLAPFGTITFSAASAIIGKPVSISTLPYIDDELCENQPTFPSYAGPTTWAIPQGLNAKGDGFSIIWGNKTPEPMPSGPAGSVKILACQ